MQGTTSATTVTGKTDKLGLFTVNGGNSNLSLNLTVADMSQTALTGKDVNYFATSSGGKKTDTTLGEDQFPSSDDDSIYTTVSKVELKDASAGTKYRCQGKFTISSDIKKTDSTSLNGEESTIKGQIQAGDGMLYLKAKEADDENVKISISSQKPSIPVEPGVTQTSHALNSLLTSSHEFWITYEFTAKGNETQSGEVQAAFRITNSNQNEQNYLADKLITVTITPDASSDKMSCEIVTD